MKSERTRTMFKYEDMDFQSLTTSLDIENPDGPEELYAMPNSAAWARAYRRVARVFPDPVGTERR